MEEDISKARKLAHAIRDLDNYRPLANDEANITLRTLTPEPGPYFKFFTYSRRMLLAVGFCRKPFIQKIGRKIYDAVKSEQVHTIEVSRNYVHFIFYPRKSRLAAVVLAITLLTNPQNYQLIDQIIKSIK